MSGGALPSYAPAHAIAAFSPPTPTPPPAQLYLLLLFLRVLLSWFPTFQGMWEVQPWQALHQVGGQYGGVLHRCGHAVPPACVTHGTVVLQCSLAVVAPDCHPQ
jgi:hypothetical protein